MNPDSLSVAAVFETLASLDKFKRQLAGGEIQIAWIYHEPPEKIEYRMVTESHNRYVRSWMKLCHIKLRRFFRILKSDKVSSTIVSNIRHLYYIKRI